MGASFKWSRLERVGRAGWVVDGVEERWAEGKGEVWMHRWVRVTKVEPVGAGGSGRVGRASRMLMCKVWRGEVGRGGQGGFWMSRCVQVTNGGACWSGWVGPARVLMC